MNPSYALSKEIAWMSMMYKALGWLICLIVVVNMGNPLSRYISLHNYQQLTAAGAFLL